MAPSVGLGFPVLDTWNLVVGNTQVTGSIPDITRYFDQSRQCTPLFYIVRIGLCDLDGQDTSSSSVNS